MCCNRVRWRLSRGAKMKSDSVHTKKFFQVKTCGRDAKLLRIGVPKTTGIETGRFSLEHIPKSLN